MGARPRARVPWSLVAGSVSLALLLFYVIFGAYLPARRQVARLEAELKALYAREAVLQNRLAETERRLEVLGAEKDALERRLDDLEDRRPRRR